MMSTALLTIFKQAMGENQSPESLLQSPPGREAGSLQLWPTIHQGPRHWAGWVRGPHTQTPEVGEQWRVQSGLGVQGFDTQTCSPRISLVVTGI